jgi:UDP-hydrolysing UDP-N-acetyl-D-glucosamine 2-epimerase
MHLEDRFGRTERVIEADGWPITARISMAEDDDRPVGVGVSTARGVEGFARAFGAERPDLLVLLGDRFEMLAAGVAALPFALPIAHIHGGEVTEGAMDNQIRHAITKLAHLHFVSTPEHAERVARMGEERWRIHTAGAPGLDRFRDFDARPRAEIASELGLPLADRWLLVTFHPVTLEPGHAAAQCEALLDALEKVHASLVMTYPNADPESAAIVERIEEFASRHPRCRLVKNLGERLYVSLLRHADAMVGNSSSGLIEAPSFGLPVVNVGSRQRGRLRGGNVIDVEPTREDILRGIDLALEPAFRAALRGQRNPYGDGGAAVRIVEVLRAVSLDARLLQKRFVDAR